VTEKRPTAKTTRFSFLFLPDFCSVNLKSAIRNSQCAILVGALLFALSLPAEAQQPGTVQRIGYLSVGSASSGSFAAGGSEAFRQGLRELGYAERKNIIIEYRFTEDKFDRLPDLAAELVRLKCDVIVTGGTEAAEAAKNTIKATPVVMAFGADAVRRGIVADLARPGGNITGLTSINAELTGKRLELLKEVVLNLSRVAVLWSPSNPDAGNALRETETAAQSLRLAIVSLEVKGRDDIEGAFEAATRRRADALMAIPSGFVNLHRKPITELAAKSRLPAVYPNTQFVEAGGLMAYGEDRLAMYQRAAWYVDKILKGAKPAELPVERPTKFQLIINLKTAKHIGLTIPQSVLYRAETVIK
jgi:putative ABC transport system substrate-binding protein